MTRDAAFKLARSKWGAIAFADVVHGICCVGVRFTIRGGQHLASQPYGTGPTWEAAFENAKLLEPGAR